MGVLRSFLSVAAVGGLLGFVVTAMVGPLLDESGWLGVRENPNARAYMVGLLEHEAHTLIALSPRSDVVSRAMQFRNSEEATGQITPVSLTYMGGRTKGPISVHVYAIELRNIQGQRQFFPLALTLAEGKVIRRE